MKTDWLLGLLSLFNPVYILLGLVFVFLDTVIAYVYNHKYSVVFKSGVFEGFTITVDQIT